MPCRMSSGFAGHPDSTLIALGTNSQEDFQELQDKELVNKIILAGVDVLHLPTEMGSKVKWYRYGACPL